jgi:predicted metal-dependent hydrolase
MNQGDKQLEIGETTIPYTVRRSKRAEQKRIEVTPEDGVLVVVPEDAPPEGEGSAAAYVRERRRWLYNAVMDLRERESELRMGPQRWETGAKLMYRGRRLMLNIEEDAEVDDVEIECRSRFHVRVPEELGEKTRRAKLRRAFGAWLKGRASRDATKFCRRYAGRLELAEELEDVRLDEQEEMWATCTKDGVVRINWRLIQAPKVGMEYVCAHEVCHLRHRHHDDEFWRELGGAMPDWREAKERLEKWESSRFEHRRSL